MNSPSSRYQVFTDEQWQQIELLLPTNVGRQGHPFGEHRRVVEGIAYRFRTGIPWRGTYPGTAFGPWQTVWKRHRRYAGDGTWDRVLARLTDADAAGQIDWTVSVDATVNRAHQHATSTTRPEQDTGGTFELQESAAGRG